MPRDVFGDCWASCEEAQARSSPWLAGGLFIHRDFKEGLLGPYRADEGPLRDYQSGLLLGGAFGTLGSDSGALQMPSSV